MTDSKEARRVIAANRNLKQLKSDVRKLHLQELEGLAIPYRKGSDDGFVLLDTVHGEAMYWLMWQTWAIDENLRGQGLWNLLPLLKPMVDLTQTNLQKTP